MIPILEFRFLVCSYLPGVPLSLGIYFYLLYFLPSQLGLSISPGKQAFLIPYIVISPILIGLFIDGLRHGIEKIAPIWEEVPLGNYTKKYDQVCLSYILARSEACFHMYEFFSNLAISFLLTYLATLPLHSKFDIGIYGLTLCQLMAILFLVCLIFALVFVCEHKKKVISKLESKKKVPKAKRAK